MQKQAGSVRSGKHRRDSREELEERKQGDKDVFACPAPRSKGKLWPFLLQRRQTGRYCATAFRHCGQAANTARDCRCAGLYFAAQWKAQPVSAVLKPIISVVVSSAAIASPPAAHTKFALCRSLCRGSGDCFRGRQVLGRFALAQGGRSWVDR